MAQIIDAGLNAHPAVPLPGHGDDLPSPAVHGLDYTAEVERATASLYARVRDVVPAIEWPALAPFVYAINELKRERDAVILAHNYMTPDIFVCVGDIRGDSLQLAREAARTEASLIVQAGVHFMAETSKILSPQKTVLIPDQRAGCSLASSITAADVRLMRGAHPGVPVVTYVNSSAEVKAESDICCTSSNAVQVTEWAAAEWGTDRVIVIPDQYLARNIAAQTSLHIITWAGQCEVHERFTAADVLSLRARFPGVQVLVHPECPPEVLAEADFAGSTAALADYVAEHVPRRVVLLTECSMSDNVALESPATEFIRPCNLCPHMKRITLAAIYDSLRHTRHIVEIPAAIAQRARESIERMLALPRMPRPAAFDTHRPPAAVTVMANPAT